MKTHSAAFQNQATVATVAGAKPARRILLLDDDRDIRRLCADVLICSGYQVDAAADGAAGWKAVNAASGDSDSYDLLITDHNMPKLSGLDLVTKLRAARMTLPVILVSGQLPAIIDAAVASGTPIHQQEWNRSLGIAAALLKPFSIDALVRTVNEVLCAAENNRGHVRPVSQAGESCPAPPA